MINFAGSEINALQLCLALRNIGMQVDVATFFYDYPIKELYENNAIQVFELFKNDLDLEKYDLLWTHHNPTLDHLIFGGLPLRGSHKIIFSTLGALEPLEAPPYYHEELKIILSNSIGNTNELVKQGVKKEKIVYFPNFAPREYFENSSEATPKKLKKIAFISHHMPDEIKDFISISKSVGLDVEHIGLGGKPRYVDPNLIRQFDLIISIGKTVQYCFALRIPIYCYDHFGGPGYLNRDNIESAKSYNFSGRGINRKLTGKGLLDDISLNFEKSCKNLDFLFNYALENFNLEKNLNEIIKLVNLSEAIDLSQIRIKYPLVNRKHIGYLRDQERIKALNSDVKKLQRSNLLGQQGIEKLNEDNQRLKVDNQRLKEDNQTLSEDS